MQKLFVISLGGSLIVPDEVDIKFLKGFKSLIERHTKRGSRFILIAGGGRICRKYQAALSKISKPDNTSLDWLGIQSTWLNAKLIQLMFGKRVNPKIVSNPNEKFNFKEKILVAGGWMPGRSTDDDAVRLALAYGGKTIINLSNIPFLYSKDPKKFKDAKKIKNISWQGLLKITGNKWNPGANLPFDPTAAKTAKGSGIRAIIAAGKNLKNLESILLGKTFEGTLIE